MKKALFLISALLSLAASFIPGLAFAADNDHLPQIFNPGIEDLSVKYLGQVFGTVGSILHGSGSQLLGRLFEIINNGLLIMAGGIIAYTIIIGIVNTASDGEIMGRKLNSFWVVFRTVLGIGALVPTASGYSTIQIVVMWVVVQGVGLANYAWGTALDYLGEQGGVVFATNENQALDTDGAQKSLQMVTNVLRSQTCVSLINQKNEKNQAFAQAAARDNPNNSTLKSLTNNFSNNAGIRYNSVDNTASFGTQSSTAACGKYNLNPPGLAAKANIRDAAAVGFNQVVLTLQPIAQKIAQYKEDASASQATRDAQKDQLNETIKMALAGAALDYENILAGAKRRMVSNANQTWLEEIKQAKKDGWINAGSYYRKLGEANNNLQQKATDYQVVMSSNINNNDISSLIDTAKFKTTSDLISAQASNAGPEMRQIMYKNNKYDKAFDPTTAGLTLGLSTAGMIGGTIASAFLMPTMLPTMAVMTGLTASLIPMSAIWIDQVNRPGDPIMKLQATGTAMTATALALWIGSTAAVTTGSTALSVMSAFTGFGYAILTSIQTFMPIITTLITTLFVTGLTLGVYVPLIPFIIFTFAAIGWIIFVLEAMAAAPLVALGVTHPEGHDLLGKSEQALMLLLSVFLRPVMMILGLIAAIIVSQVSLNILNAGFTRIVSSTGVIGSGIGLFGFVALMIIYAMIVLSIINMSSNLIILIDQKVKAWIGLHPDSSTFDHQLGEIKGGLGSAGQSMAGGATQALSSRSINKPKESDAQGQAELASNKWITQQSSGNSSASSPAGNQGPGLSGGSGNSQPPGP